MLLGIFIIIRNFRNIDQPPQLLQRRHSQKGAPPQISYSPNGRVANQPANEEFAQCSPDKDQTSSDTSNQPPVECPADNNNQPSEAYTSDSPSIRYIDSQSQSSGSPPVSKTSQNTDSHSQDSGRAPCIYIYIYIYILKTEF